MASPYRTPASIEEPAPGEEDEGEYAVRAILVVLWVTSIVRAFGAIGRHEHFGAEPTLAMAVVFLTPWMLKETFRTRGRPRKPERPPDENAGGGRQS